MNTKYVSKVNRMKNTRFGKFVCRLMGEEQGAVMMEYVMVAIGVAAVVALGAFFFGSTILDLFNLSAKSASGDATGAASGAETLMDTTVPERISNAAANGDKFNTTSPGGR